MAMMLKQMHGLLALRAVLLRPTASTQTVKFTLEHHGRGDDPALGTFTVDGKVLDPRRATAPSPALMAIAEWVGRTAVEFDVPPGLPLWLHLQKPYGWLGSVLWETALEAAAQRPVLRLPDFLERCQENQEALDVAICSDLPESLDSVAQLAGVMRSILQGSPRPRTHVHVFAMPQNSRALQASFGHVPGLWFAPVPSPTGVGGSSWLLAMSSALRERSVDVAHFVCRGELSSDRPRLKLVDPPDKAGLARVHFASTGEIADALTRLGAWAVVLTLPHGGSALPLRWFADAFAQARPGAVLYDEGEGLEDQYRFLFSTRLISVPRLSPAFLYCQPSIAMEMPDGVPARAKAVGQNAHLFLTKAAGVIVDAAEPLVKKAGWVAGFAGGALASILEAVRLRAPAPPWSADTIPTWMAAAQRYVEAASLSQVRKMAPDALLGDRVQSLAERVSESDAAVPTPAKDEIVDRTLSDLQTIVARYASKERS